MTFYYDFETDWLVEPGESYRDAMNAAIIASRNDKRPRRVFLRATGVTNVFTMEGGFGAATDCHVTCVGIPNEADVFPLIQGDNNPPGLMVNGMAEGGTLAFQGLKIRNGQGGNNYFNFFKGSTAAKATNPPSNLILDFVDCEGAGRCAIGSSQNFVSASDYYASNHRYRPVNDTVRAHYSRFGYSVAEHPNYTAHGQSAEYRGCEFFGPPNDGFHTLKLVTHRAILSHNKFWNCGAEGEFVVFDDLGYGKTSNATLWGPLCAANVTVSPYTGLIARGNLFFGRLALLPYQSYPKRRITGGWRGILFQNRWSARQGAGVRWDAEKGRVINDPVAIEKNFWDAGENPYPLLYESSLWTDEIWDAIKAGGWQGVDGDPTNEHLFHSYIDENTWQIVDGDLDDADDAAIPIASIHGWPLWISAIGNVQSPYHAYGPGYQVDKTTPACAAGTIQRNRVHIMPDLQIFSPPPGQVVGIDPEATAANAAWGILRDPNITEVSTDSTAQEMWLWNAPFHPDWNRSGPYEEGSDAWTNHIHLHAGMIRPGWWKQDPLYDQFKPLSDALTDGPAGGFQGSTIDVLYGRRNFSGFPPLS